MFEIFGSAMPAVNDFESGLWMVEVAEARRFMPYDPGFAVCRTLQMQC